MRRLVTWTLIILVFGLGLMWMATSAQANPLTLPAEKAEPATPTTAPGPSISEQVGAAARSAVDQATEVGTRVVERS